MGRNAPSIRLKTLGNYVQITRISPRSIGLIGCRTGNIKAIFTADWCLFVVVGVLRSRPYLPLVRGLRYMLRPFNGVMALHLKALSAKSGLSANKS